MNSNLGKGRANQQNCCVDLTTVYDGKFISISPFCSFIPNPYLITYIVVTLQRMVSLPIQMLSKSLHKYLRAKKPSIFDEFS